MKKGRDLIGLPIINLSDGETVGRVKDVLFNPGTSKVNGVVVDIGGWLKGARKICFQDFVAVGEDAITIADDRVVVKMQPDEECILSSEGAVVGNKVMTKDGNELGTIADIIFDPASGAVTHYQLSDGFFQDLFEGRETIALTAEFQYGKDAIIVDKFD